MTNGLLTLSEICYQQNEDNRIAYCQRLELLESLYVHVHVLPKRFYHSKNINFSVYIKIPRVKISKAIKIHQLDSNVYFCLYQNQHHANEQTEIF